MKPKVREAKRTRLIPVLVGIVAMGLFAADASAMYQPGMGTFMQRDPGAGGTNRLGAAGAPAATGSFIPRDQYRDGMNLYQYVRGNPVKLVDPAGTKGFVTIYYTGDADKSFQRAAKTWVSEIKAGVGGYWDARCDYVIEKSVLTEADFYTAWNAINAEVKKRLKSPKKYTKKVPADPKKPDGPTKDEECTCDERIAIMTLFTHASKGDTTPGLHFKPSPGHDGTLSLGDISGLAILDWHPTKGELRLHGCNTGLPTTSRGKKGPAVAQAFRDRQGVVTIGQRGYSSFSENEKTYDEIDASSTKVYLWAYKRGKNSWFGDGSAMPGVRYPKP